MAFSTSQDIMSLVGNRLIKDVWQTMLNSPLPKTIPSMTYRQAMQEYGSDKPDLRIPFRIKTNIEADLPPEFVKNTSSLNDPAIDVLHIPFHRDGDITEPAKTREFVRKFLDSQAGSEFSKNPNGNPGVLIFDSKQPLQGLSALGFEGQEAIQMRLGELEDGDLLIFQARPDLPLSGGATELGNMRLALHAAAVDFGLLKPLPWKVFEPVWIVDFPLFSPISENEPGQGGRAGFASTHHPFTSPKTAADVDILFTNPRAAIGDHYDLVINGEEIGGGSRRIHDAAVQEFIFREVLKMDEEKIREFDPLLEALKAACPPHAGIALGFDRLVAMIRSHQLGRKVSIRDTIAFPKTGSGEDPMTKSPGLLTDEQLQRYHLDIVK